MRALGSDRIDRRRRVLAIPRSPKTRRLDCGNKYLCRDDLATSCAVTLVGDVAPSNDRARSASTRPVGTYLETAHQADRSGQAPTKEDEGHRRVSTLVEAVSMARAGERRKALSRNS